MRVSGMEEAGRIRVYQVYIILSQGIIFILVGANPAMNTPRPSRGTRIESCDFIVLIGDP